MPHVAHRPSDPQRSKLDYIQFSRLQTQLPSMLDVSSLRALSGRMSEGQRSRENVECFFPQSYQPVVTRISADSVYIAILGESQYQKRPPDIYSNITSSIHRNRRVQVATRTWRQARGTKPHSSGHQLQLLGSCSRSHF